MLAGSVAEHSAYHHGEASLMSIIIGLAQNFVGSNNNNLVLPINGQFGTRLQVCLINNYPKFPINLHNMIPQGGNDAASPRYIFTLMSKLLS